VTCTGWLAINGRTTAVTMSSMLHKRYTVGLQHAIA
jgi:hypothetical protein